MFIDSHCHLDQLDLTTFSTPTVASVLEHAAELGVTHFLNVCIDLEHFKDVLTIAEQFPNVDCSVGLHPNELVNAEPSVAELIQLAQSPKVIAIGETGLDYYRSDADNTFQHARFATHIEAAKQTKKPLIVHSRQAKADTINLLTSEKADEIGGVLHCFTEDWEMAKQAIDLNFYISFSGIVTFKNAKNLQDVAKKSRSIAC